MHVSLTLKVNIFESLLNHSFEAIFAQFFSNLPYKRVKFLAQTRLIEGCDLKSRNGTPSYKNRVRAPPPPGPGTGGTIGEA